MQELIPRIASLKTPKLVFNNVRSLNWNHEYVRKDENLLAADLLVFVESRACQEDAEKLALDGFQFSYFNEERLRYIICCVVLT